MEGYFRRIERHWSFRDPETQPVGSESDALALGGSALGSIIVNLPEGAVAEILRGKSTEPGIRVVQEIIREL